jgi:membrane fusion protein, multidrug efflux system
MGDIPSDPKTPAKRGAWWRRNLVKAIIVLAALAILVSLMKMPPRQQETSASAAPLVDVIIAVVTAEPNLVDAFELPGVVEPNRIVTVSAELAGRIEQLPHKKGAPIKAGDLLVQLDASMLQPAFDGASAQVERDQIEFDRMAGLVERNATSRQDLDTARSQLTMSQASLGEIRARLKRMRIFSTTSGILNDLPVEEGEYVQPGTPVAEIVDAATVKVAVRVPERDVAFFAVGRTTQVSADTQGPPIMREGVISFISELADHQTRSTRMEINLDNSDRGLRCGQIVHVYLTRRVLDNVIMIPLMAVIPMEDSKAVYVVNASQTQRREIELGIIRGDRVQVRQGLEVGDRLIVSGHRFVAPGQNVNVVGPTKNN